MIPSKNLIRILALKGNKKNFTAITELIGDEE